MNSNKNKLRLLVLAGLAIIALVMIALVVATSVRGTQLRVETIDPADGGTIPGEGVVMITFNRDIASANVTLEPEAGYEVVANGKNVTLIPYTTFENNTTYTMTIQEAVSADGKTLTNHTSTFSTNNTHTQSPQNAEQTRYQTLEERTALKYPFMVDLYREDPAFIISTRIETTPYTHPVYDRKKYKDITVLIRLRPETLAGPLRGQELTNELLKSRQKAHDYMQSRDLNPSDFVIEYTPNIDDTGETDPSHAH